MSILRLVPPTFVLLAFATTACSQATATSAADAAADTAQPAAAAGAARPPAARAAATLVPTPFDGIWRQASVTCSDGRTPTEPVRELSFREAGAFDVTFVPFETYKDYWGHYEVDEEKGRIAFRKEGGNFIPGGLKLEGEMALDGDTLTIRDVWFGDRAPGAPASKGCDYVFSRYLGGE